MQGHETAQEIRAKIDKFRNMASLVLIKHRVLAAPVFLTPEFVKFQEQVLSCYHIDGSASWTCSVLKVLKTMSRPIGTGF